MLRKYNVEKKGSSVKKFFSRLKLLVMLSIFIYLSAQVGKLIIKPVLIMLIIAVIVNIILGIRRK